MKQIERKGSAQRELCELLGRLGPLTIKDLAARRGIDARSTARQLDALVEAGYVQFSGRPRLYERTDKMLPPAIARKPKSEAIARRRRRDEESVARPLVTPQQRVLDAVFLAWKGDRHARP
jgi:predicted ArsR family transcriptional regulator